MRLDQSRMYRNISETAIAHGALTNSKRPSVFVEGVYPTHAIRGSRCFLYDADGYKYVDYCCALGTNLFGYGNSTVAAAVYQALMDGALFTLSSTKEAIFAQTIRGLFPFLERLRILKSGSEGCSAAIRIARAFRGKDLVLSDGYHGWHDDFTSLTPPAHGVPAREKDIQLLPMEYPDALLKKAAAVIIEPVILDASQERIAWVRKLREDCTRLGTILIFDETITAYRFPKYSFAKYTGCYPDLFIAGKALANGMPISVVGGRADVMECDYFVSSTFAGDLAAIAAAMACCDLIVDSQWSIEELWNEGEKFLAEFNAIDHKIQLVGYPTRAVFKGDDLMKALFWQECLYSGVLFGPSWFINRFHIAERDNVMDICKTVIAKINNNKVALRGKVPRTPFAKKEFER